jgi:hypothetical protein
MIKTTDSQFWSNRTWKEALFKWEDSIATEEGIVAIFDQNGYRLTKLEQLYSIENKQPFVLHGDEKSLRKIWMVHDPVQTGPHLNHAFLFERKGYSGDALKQLKYFANKNNLIHKLINYKGKWGVDLSMDYVDNLGNSMEILHFEYDSYNIDEIQEMKGRVEERVASIDWEWAAKQVLEKKDEWINLEFFDQSEWKTNFFGLPKERFKVNAWE